MARGRTEKVVDLAVAARLVASGCRLALGGFSLYQHPMAFVRELIRQRISELTIVGTVSGPEVDLLAGAGLLRRVESSYVGLESFGLAQNFRRAVERGEVEMVDYSELLSFDRFRASQDGLPFYPCFYLGGTDLVARNPDIVAAKCPITGRPFYAVPAADPDVVVIHAAKADRFGNVSFPARRQLPQELDLIMARSADTVIVTVEEIVASSEITVEPQLVELPAFRTTCVVEAKGGAHPCSSVGYYSVDERHLADLVGSSDSDSAFQDYLDRYVLRSETGYAARVGAAGEVPA